MTNEELFARTALHSWTLVLERIEKGFASLSDDDLQREVAPGRNRIYYLLGHLTAVHDRLLPLLGLGERLHPELDQPFLADPDRAHPDPVPAPELRQAWSAVNGRLAEGFAAFAPEDWLKPHNAISAEDFAREPHRNRLAVLLSRTAHADFHAGQMVLAMERK